MKSAHMFFETWMHDPHDKRPRSRRRRPWLAAGALGAIAAAGLLFLGFVFFGQGGVKAEEPPLSHFIPPRQQLAALEIEPVKLGVFGEEPGRGPRPVIPVKAVIYAGDAAQVWVAGNDGSLALRDVRLGAAKDDRVEVTRGLSAGEKIVTNAPLFADRTLSGQ